MGERLSGDKVRFWSAWTSRKALAELLTVYGSADSARVCADSLIDSMGIPCVFSEEVQREAKESAARRDSLGGTGGFSGPAYFTIDGEDARIWTMPYRLKNRDRMDSGRPYRRRNPIMSVPGQHWMPKQRRQGTSVYLPTG